MGYCNGNNGCRNGEMLDCDKGLLMLFYRIKIRVVFDDWCGLERCCIVIVDSEGGVESEL